MTAATGRVCARSSRRMSSRPLRLCGLTKAEVRRRSKAAGLFTWDKPAYACLATRVPTGEPITAEKLRAVERSEAYLFALGFTDLRVRLRDGGALLQLPAAQHAAARARWRRSPQDCPNTFPPSDWTRKRGRRANENFVYRLFHGLRR